jgi:short-subunit dehydrogenase
MGSFETGTGRSPPCEKESEFDTLTTIVPSSSEALQKYSAVVVTGGSSGIGKSFIRQVSKLKPDLVFCNLSRRSPGEKKAGVAHERLNHFACDLSRPDEVARAAEEVVAFLEKEVPVGGVLLINNSGIGAFERFPEPNLGRQLEIVDLNVRAVVELTGRLLPLLRARGGAVVNIASTVAYVPTPFAATYGASKAFVLHWTLALNEELRGSGVRALAVCPGTTATDFFRSAGMGEGMVAASLSMTPEAVVESALQALGAGRAQVVPGWMNKCYTWVGARLPKPAAAWLAGKVLGRRCHNGAAA